MSNQAGPARPPRQGTPTNARPPGLTTAALKALKDGKAGTPAPPPWRMPEVEAGEIVQYQPTAYSPSKPGAAALVITVGAENVELLVLDREQGFRLLPDAARHKDDPNFERLRRVNELAEERYEMGVWYRKPGDMTPSEKRRAKLLLEIFEDDLDEFERSGTIHGKTVTTPNGTTPAV